MSTVRVAVVAEFYPRAGDPVLGVWAHRQALAARDAGADVRVLVLHRPIPPRAARGRERLLAARTLLAQPARAHLDGLDVRYVRFVAPPRPRAYGEWGRWAARPLGRALGRLRREFPFDLIHAHNAVPAGDAVRRAAPGTPLVVSVHGGDVFHTAPGSPAGAAAVRDTFATADLVLANSHGIARAAADLGARDPVVVPLGADIPAHAPALTLGRRDLDGPVLVSIGHLVARKRHGDVLRAMWLLRDHHPSLRYVVIGDGPERGRLEALAGRLGLAGRVTFTGQLEPAAALHRAQAEGQIFVMPSVDEALGVAYLEAMAAGMPAIGCLGEPGPSDIAEAGDGMVLVAPGDVEALASAVGTLAADPAHRAAVGAAAQATVRAHFTWAACGTATVAAYERALER